MTNPTPGPRAGKPCQGSNSLFGRQQPKATPVWKSPGSHGFQIPQLGCCLDRSTVEIPELKCEGAPVAPRSGLTGRWTVGFAIRFIDTTPYAFYSSPIARISSAVR
jgi:hypothetical protein